MTTPAEHAEAAIAMLDDTCQKLGLQIRGAIYCTVAFAVNEERERCALLAEGFAILGHSVQEPSCREIARKIREG